MATLPTIVHASVDTDQALESVSNAQQTAPDTGTIKPLDLSDEGWTLFSGEHSHNITSFEITINEKLTGWLGCGKEFSDNEWLGSASYYLRYDDGVKKADINYAFRNNSMYTSRFYALIYDGTSFTYHDIGRAAIESIWLKEVLPGYTALLLKGNYRANGLELDVSVVLTPNFKGTVEHDWQITNLSATDVNIGAVFMIDTELNKDDTVPVYSAGTNRGMYIDKVDGFVRLFFPYVPESAGGPFDYSAGNWASDSDFIKKITNVFGANLDIVMNRDIPREFGDVLISDVDSAVFFRYLPGFLAVGSTRGFIYHVSLGEPEDIKMDPPLFAVSFNSAGGTSVVSQTVEYGSLAKEPEPPTRTGYSFVGWLYNGKPYDFATPVTFDIILTAAWSINKHTVSFDSAGGTDVASQTVEYGSSAVEPASPTRTGSGFVGWLLDGEPYDFATPVTGDIILTAAWGINKHTVSFDSAGGTDVASQTIEYGSLAKEPAPPTRTGYGFIGWLLDGQPYDFATPVTLDFTLTAAWSINKHTVSFDSTGGSSVASQTVEYGSLAVEPAPPTRPGYGFVGWLLNGEPYDFATPVTGDITLTADWSINKHTVSFDSAGGTDVASQTVEYGFPVKEPEPPTCPGYSFVGWLLDGQPYDFATSVTTDIILTAAWEPAASPTTLPETGDSIISAVLSLVSLLLSAAMFIGHSRRYTRLAQN
jgi:uncharacterized repeat protein (TIGR02543 family)